MSEIKDKLGLVVSVTAPKHICDNDAAYQREQTTLFLGKIVDGKKFWTEVSLPLFYIYDWRMILFFVPFSFGIVIHWCSTM